MFMYYTYMHFHCVLSRQKNNVLYNLTSLLSGSVIVGLDLPQQKVYLHIYKLVTTNQGLIQGLGAILAPHITPSHPSAQPKISLVPHLQLIVTLVAQTSITSEVSYG